MKYTHVESLLLDFPLARHEIRRGSFNFKLAFCRAVVQVAKVIRHRREYGEDFTVLETFVDLRKAKQRAALDQMRLKEPTKRVLANNIIEIDLALGAYCTEAFAKEGESGRDALAAQLRAAGRRQARPSRRQARCHTQPPTCAGRPCTPAASLGRVQAAGATGARSMTRSSSSKQSLQSKQSMDSMLSA